MTRNSVCPSLAPSPLSPLSRSHREAEEGAGLTHVLSPRGVQSAGAAAGASAPGGARVADKASAAPLLNDASFPSQVEVLTMYPYWKYLRGRSVDASRLRPQGSFTRGRGWEPRAEGPATTITRDGRAHRSD